MVDFQLDALEAQQARLNQMIPTMRDLNPTGKKLPATAITIVD